MIIGHHCGEPSWMKNQCGYIPKGIRQLHSKVQVPSTMNSFMAQQVTHWLSIAGWSGTERLGGCKRDFATPSEGLFTDLYRTNYTAKANLLF